MACTATRMNAMAMICAPLLPQVAVQQGATSVLSGVVPAFLSEQETLA
jgi:hypothetical protein